MTNNYENGIFRDHLTKAQAADFLGVSVPTLDRWNRLGMGPVRTKIGKRVLFQLDALNAWVIAQREEVGQPRQVA